MRVNPAIRRDNPNSNMPILAGAYPVLAVRDFITLKLAERVDIDIPVKVERSAAEWAALRKTVERKLEDVLGR